MRSFSRLRSLAAPLLVLLAAALLTTACDTAGTDSENTITLNDPINPTTVTYEFEYNPSTAVNNEVGVVSSGNDNLGSIISSYGFSRDDVVSARVTSITISRSAGSTVRVPKLYDYVQNIEMHLGNSESGPLIAGEQQVSSTLSTSLTPADTDVTSTVQSGSSPSFMIIGVSNTNEQQGFIEATVDYRIEVRTGS
jgi:hypothetical protein